MDLSKANDQLDTLKPFQFCYVQTVSDHDTTATGSYVVNDSEGNAIFARSVDMLTREIIKTEHFLGEEYGDIKKVFEEHYSLDFIFNDCIILSFELVRDRALYSEDTFNSHDKYGEQVYYSDVDYLRAGEGLSIQRRLGRAPSRPC